MSDACLDRAKGALLGLAVGDAVGTTLEFSRRDSYSHLTDMIGGGPFDLKPGEWTDDTAMALALADSLIAHPVLDEADLMARFTSWYDLGIYSCTGECFDIGITTRKAIGSWKTSGNPIAGATDPQSAGNGSLMRLSPVSVRHWNDPDILADVAARQSKTTHGAPEAVDACVAFGLLLAEAIKGQPAEMLLSPKDTGYSARIGKILAGAWRGKARHEIASSGYVAHSLEAAFWCVAETDNFRDAVLLAANLGDDADTTAAITGQLAGAVYGASNIPAEWLGRLAWKEDIEAKAAQLFDAALP
jgi:ADP-ribosyl-[dinitrogen reductase] hydrolase